jgi:hypothetical protein
LSPALAALRIIVLQRERGCQFRVRNESGHLGDLPPNHGIARFTALRQFAWRKWIHAFHGAEVIAESLDEMGDCGGHEARNGNGPPRFKVVRRGPLGDA